MNITQKNPVGVRKDSRWTEEMHGRLIVLWKDQNSASIIAKTIFNEFGVAFTRNAVIGKIHRLGLSGQGAKPSITRKGESKARPRKPKLAPVPAPKTPEIETCDYPACECAISFPEVYKPSTATECPEAALPADEIEVAIPITGRVTLEELRSNHCRWPYGDPREENFSYCGCTATPGKPYCAHHMSAAYVPVQRGKKVAWRAFR